MVRIARLTVSGGARVEHQFASGKFPKDSLVLWMEKAEGNVTTVSVEIEAFNGNLSVFESLPFHL